VSELSGTILGLWYILKTYKVNVGYLSARLATVLNIVPYTISTAVEVPAGKAAGAFSIIIGLLFGLMVLSYVSWMETKEKEENENQS